MASGLHGMASQPAVPGLFVDRPDLAARLQDVASQPDTLRARSAAVNLAALDQDLIDLALFDGTTLRAVLDHRIGNADGSASWSGRVDGDALSAVTFVRAGNIVQGAIRTIDAAYTIEPLPGAALHAIRQVDLSQLGPELPPLVPTTTALQAAALDDPPMSGDDGSTFRRAGGLHPGCGDRGGWHECPAGADQSRHHRDQHGIREQRHHPAAPPGGNRARHLHRERRPGHRSRRRHGHLRRADGQSAQPAQLARRRPGAAGRRQHHPPSVWRGLADAVAVVQLRHECVQRDGVPVHQPELHVRPRDGSQHGLDPRAQRSGRRTPALRVFVRVQAPVERVPHGDGLRLSRELPSHPVPLRTRR